jgi:hypothetical protein
MAAKATRALARANGQTAVSQKTTQKAASQKALLALLKAKEADLVMNGGILHGLTEAEAANLMERAFRIASTGGGLRGAVAASESDITDELSKGGPAFGDFVKSVGLAVAEAQTKLDETLTATAKKLSDTLIDVIAVFEQQIDDNGVMVAGNPIVQRLPLINYLMPTAYQWSRVFLQADMNVSEFNGANGFNIQGKSESVSARASASYGLIGGFGASVSGGYSNSSYQASGETSFSRDTGAGSLHMEATLEPRADVQLPRPFILQKGPRLKLVSGSRQDIMNTATPPVAVGRKVVITAELKNAQNGALSGKTLEIKVENPSLNYTVAQTDGKTDSNGTLSIEVRREGAAFDPNRAPEPVLVRVWMGLVSQEIGINV